MLAHPLNDEGAAICRRGRATGGQRFRLEQGSAVTRNQSIPNAAPQIGGFTISAQDRADLIEFLKSLTDEEFFTIRLRQPLAAGERIYWAGA